jgi:tetratricopeptide (TPR) repeat protein
MAYLSWLVGLLRPPLQLVFAATALAALAVAGFLPLLAGPGYEGSLVAGLVLPSLVACATALETARWPTLPSLALSRGISRGALYALAALVLALGHGLRVGFCDPLADTALWVLGAGCGAVMGGAWGTCAGLVAGRLQRGRTALAMLLGCAGPAGGIAVSLWRFYASPMVFAYDPWFGLFAGPLYEGVIEHLDRLAVYRLGSLLTLTAVAIGLSHLDRDRDGRVTLRRTRRPGLLVLGLAAAASSGALTLFGDRLGHFSTDVSVRTALGRQVTSQRCDVIYASSILDRDARLLARECDGHIRQLEAYFGASGPPRVSVLLFASAADKGRLIGAAATHVAKPWRAEVYVQQRGFPHPVLRHELAHVVAASFARGPFRIAGPLAGLIPDPGRIEGVAVAAAPPGDADLTLQQWAGTLRRLGLLPPLSRLFRLSFLAVNSSRAYLVAGAFVQWLHERYGAQAVRRWYGGSQLKEVSGGKSLRLLEAEWHSSLALVPVAPEAEHAARALFDRPAIFGRRCPHVVDRLERDARELLSRRDHAGAWRAYEKLLELDPSHTEARLGLGTCALRAGNEADARRRWEAMAADEGLRRLERAAAEEKLADLDLLAGHFTAAARRYHQLEQLFIDTDQLRALQLKQSARDELSRAAVAALLVGDPTLGPSWGVAASRLSIWAERQPEQGTASYLLARNFFLRGRWDEAAAHLGQALQREIEPVRIRTEAWRLMAVLACARTNLESAGRAYQRYRQEPADSHARREAMQRFAHRCGILQP